MKEMQKVIVERSYWLRGEGEENSKLLRTEDGKMCCLGFVCLAFGKTEDDIAECEAPSCFSSHSGRKIGFGTPLIQEDGSEPQAVVSAMQVNDHRHMDESQRESELKRLLLVVGVDLEFVD